MANGAGETQKIKLGSVSLSRLGYVLWPIVAVSIGMYVTSQLHSYRIERAEKDIADIQVSVQRDMPEIKTQLIEIRAELKWMGRSLGVPAKHE